MLNVEIELVNKEAQNKRLEEYALGMKSIEERMEKKNADEDEKEGK